MTDDRDPFDGPSPVGPLGEALARLTDDAPPTGFSEATVRGDVDNRRAVRRQAFGGLAAAAAAITVLVVLVSSLGGNGADTATSAMSSSAAATSASSAAATSASAAATSSSSSVAASGGGLSTSTASGPDAAGAPGKAPDLADGSTGDASAESAGCRRAPLAEAQLRAVEGVLVGATRLDDCAPTDADLGVQRYTVAGGSVLVERRAGGYDPCDGGAVCAEVADRPGIRSADLAGATQVWVTGRDGAIVLTADPTGTIGVDALAAAAAALVAAGA